MARVKCRYRAPWEQSEEMCFIGHAADLDVWFNLDDGTVAAVCEEKHEAALRGCGEALGSNPRTRNPRARWTNFYWTGEMWEPEDNEVVLSPYELCVLYALLENTEAVVAFCDAHNKEE